jgi:hypothetical protein
MSSVMTNNSLDVMGVKKATACMFVVKAVNVLLTEE